MALPPPRLPVPPHQLSPPRVGHGSSPLKFCVSVCPSKPFFHEFLPLHLRWPFTAQPTGCVRTLWPWWPCCSCCWRHGSNTDYDDGARWSLRQTGDKKKKNRRRGEAPGISGEVWVSATRMVLFIVVGRCTVCVLMLPVLTSASSCLFVFNSIE